MTRDDLYAELKDRPLQRVVRDHATGETRRELERIHIVFCERPMEARTIEALLRVGRHAAASMQASNGKGDPLFCPVGCVRSRRRTGENIMGQAFDEKGNVLGEAYGETKAEVAKKLEDRFGDQIDRMEIQRTEPASGQAAPSKSDHAKNVEELMRQQNKQRADHANSVEPMLQHFRYQHLPEHLGAISRPFGELAQQIVMTLPRNPERSVALRKLLEAKDAAVRAALTE